MKKLFLLSLLIVFAGVFGSTPVQASVKPRAVPLPEPKPQPKKPKLMAAYNTPGPHKPKEPPNEVPIPNPHSPYPPTLV